MNPFRSPQSEPGGVDQSGLAVYERRCGKLVFGGLCLAFGAVFLAGAGAASAEERLAGLVGGAAAVAVGGLSLWFGAGRRLLAAIGGDTLFLSTDLGFWASLRLDAIVSVTWIDRYNEGLDTVRLTVTDAEWNAVSDSRVWSKGSPADSALEYFFSNDTTPPRQAFRLALDDAIGKQGDSQIDKSEPFTITE